MENIPYKKTHVKKARLAHTCTHCNQAIKRGSEYWYLSRKRKSLNLQIFTETLKFHIVCYADWNRILQKKEAQRPINQNRIKETLQEVVAYKANDGSLHERRDQAEKRNTTLKTNFIRRNIRYTIEQNMSSGYRNSTLVEEIFKFLIINHKRLIQLLSQLKE